MFGVIVVPAYWMAERANPGFLHTFLVSQNLGRLIGSENFRRDHPLWYYMPIFAAGFLPGSLHVPAITRGLLAADDGTRGTRRFLACAVAGPFVLLSAAHSMLAYYLLPLAPPFALLSADALLRKDAADGTSGGSRRRGAFGYAAFATLFTLLALAALAGAPRRPTVCSRFFRRSSHAARTQPPCA